MYLFVEFFQWVSRAANHLALFFLHIQLEGLANTIQYNAMECHLLFNHKIQYIDKNKLNTRKASCLKPRVLKLFILEYEILEKNVRQKNELRCGV